MMSVKTKFLTNSLTPVV